MTESRRSNLLRQFWDSASMLLVLLTLFVVLSITVDGFLSRDNMIGLALSVSMVGMVACTMLFCLASGDFDLSIEAVVAFSGVLAAMTINATGSVVLGVVAGMSAGALIGVINGMVISKLHINALITTLATMQIARGLGLIICHGEAVSIPNEKFFSLGASAPLGIPNPVWITAFSFVVFGFLLNKTRFGRHTLAIGGNKEAARLAGVAVDRIKIAIFTIQGIMAALGGVILASRMTSGQPNISAGFSLDVISACVLGGVSLSGGVGTMTGTVVGVLIMGTVQNALNLTNVPTFYQYLVRGGILLAAVVFDQWKNSRRRF